MRLLIVCMAVVCAAAAPRRRALPGHVLAVRGAGDPRAGEPAGHAAGGGDSGERDSYNFLAIFALMEDPKTHKLITVGERVPLDANDLKYLLDAGPELQLAPTDPEQPENELAGNESDLAGNEPAPAEKEPELAESEPEPADNTTDPSTSELELHLLNLI